MEQVHAKVMQLNLEGNPLTGEFAQEHGEVSVRGHANYSGVQKLAEGVLAESLRRDIDLPGA